jgi:hypothetical protein
MGLFFGLALMLLVGALMLGFVVHMILSIPLWLLLGGVALFIYLRKSSHGRRMLGRGAYPRRYLNRW